MIWPTVTSDLQSDAGRNPRKQAKEKTQPKAKADTEDNGIRYRASKQPQRTVLSAQQVIGKIETAQHIKTRSRNADGRGCVMVHAMIVELTQSAFSRLRKNHVQCFGHRFRLGHPQYRDAQESEKERQATRSVQQEGRSVRPFHLFRIADNAGSRPVNDHKRVSRS